MYILFLFVLAFGLLIGSFLNVVIHRVPINKSVVFPKSRCPKCQSAIKWYYNVPVLGYLFLGGKCADCKNKIPWRYPLVELLTGIFALLLFPTSLSIHDLANYAYLFSVACIFLCHFVIDIEHHLLPDKINLYFLFITLPYVMLNFQMHYWLIGGLVGIGIPYLVTYIFYKLKGQIGLGGGDIKLYGILGLLLGAEGVLHNLSVSCMLGAIGGLLLLKVRGLGKDTPFAFGPYIIITASVQIFTPNLWKIVNPMTWF